MTALFRLQAHWSKLSADQRTSLLKTDAAIEQVDQSVANFVKTAEKIEADLKVKTPKRVDEWLELARVSHVCGRPAINAQQVDADLKQARRVKHDTLAALEKRMGS
jgi:hypothetical protein